MKTVCTLWIALIMTTACYAEQFVNPHFETVKNQFSTTILHKASDAELESSLRAIIAMVQNDDDNDEDSDEDETSDSDITSALCGEMDRVMLTVRDACIESLMQKLDSDVLLEDPSAGMHIIFSTEAASDFCLIEAVYRIIYEEARNRAMVNLNTLPSPSNFVRDFFELKSQENAKYREWFFNTFGL
jgi:hypothetical protein